MARIYTNALRGNSSPNGFVQFVSLVVFKKRALLAKNEDGGTGGIVMQNEKALCHNEQTAALLLYF